MVDTDRNFLTRNVNLRTRKGSLEFISSIPLLSRRNAFIESQSIHKSFFSAYYLLTIVLDSVEFTIFRIFHQSDMRNSFFLKFFLKGRFLKTYREAGRGGCCQEQKLIFIGQILCVTGLLFILSYLILKPMAWGRQHYPPLAKEGAEAREKFFSRHQENNGQSRICVEDYIML